MKAYKDSGIKWLGKIPTHWEVMKLKFLAKNIIGGGTPNTSNKEYWSENDLNSYLWVSIEDISKSSFIVNTKRKITRKGIDNSSAKIVPPYSILYSIYASLGKVAYSDKELTTNQAILSIELKDRFYYKYYFYFLQSITKSIMEMSLSTTQNNISLSILQDFFVLVPPLKEQEQIVRFLDEKCEKIDTFIAKQLKFIELLKEQKQVLINQVTTKGLNKSTELKDTHIPHLGKIPTHWEVKKLKYVVFNNTKKGILSDFKIGLENIESKTTKFIESDEMPFENDGIIFNKGDVLFGKLRPYLTKVYLAEQSGLCVSEFLVLRATKILNIYLKYLLLSGNLIEIINTSTIGSKMPRTNWEFVGNLEIPLPPLKEQEQIVRFLDEKCDKIDKAINNITKQIELMKEYKISLINTAIKGE